MQTLGIIFAIEYFDKYLKTKFIVHTDHKPLTTIKEGKVHKRTLERFKVILADYDFELVYTPGDSMPADFISRHVKVESVNFEPIKSKELKEVLDGTVQGQAHSKMAVHACTAWDNTEKSATHLKQLGGRAQQMWAQAQECAVQAMIAEQHSAQASSVAPPIVKASSTAKSMKSGKLLSKQAKALPTNAVTGKELILANHAVKEGTAIPTLREKFANSANQL